MTILVAVDFAHNSESALRVGSMLAQATGEGLGVLHVVDFTGGDDGWRVLYEAPDEIEASAEESAMEKLSALCNEVLAPEARQNIRRWVAFGTPYDGILETARDANASTIVVGTRGESRLQEMFFGRTPNRLVRAADVPVVAVPPDIGTFDAIEKVLAPVDFSECSRASLRVAADVCRDHGATLDVLNAVVIPHETIVGAPLTNVRVDVARVTGEREEEIAELVAEEGAGDVLGEVFVETLRPHRAILDAAERHGHDLVCMGTHGRSGFARWFLGSTAEAVLRETKRPTMVVRTEA